MPDNVKTLHVDITKGARDGQWVMGASARDRVDDTIAPEAFEAALKRARRKLIALWQHQNDKPIGFWENMVHEKGKLIGDLKIAGTNLGRMIKQLLEDGVPLGASIGFRGLDLEPNDHGGFHFKDIEILETSIVSVPANAAAIQIAKSLDCEQFLDPVRPGDEDRQAKSGTTPRMEIALKRIEDARRVLEIRSK